MEMDKVLFSEDIFSAAAFLAALFSVLWAQIVCMKSMPTGYNECEQPRSLTLCVGFTSLSQNDNSLSTRLCTWQKNPPSSRSSSGSVCPPPRRIFIVILIKANEMDRGCKDVAWLDLAYMKKEKTRRGTPHAPQKALKPLLQGTIINS